MKPLHEKMIGASPFEGVTGDVKMLSLPVFAGGIEKAGRVGTLT